MGLEIVLAIIGILLTIIFSNPIMYAFREFAEYLKRKKWTADLQVEKGIIQQHEHYAFEFWRQIIKVDKDGRAVHSIDARVVNRGPKLLMFLSFPIYCDAQRSVADAEVQPWAKCGRRRLLAQLEGWIPRRARGRVKIALNPAIVPTKSCRLRWGYCLPDTFRPGDEYYNWDIAVPHYAVQGELQFDEPWRIVYVRWDGEIANTQEAPTLVGTVIKWQVRFPRIGQRITMRFGLERTID